MAYPPRLSCLSKALSSLLALLLVACFLGALQGRALAQESEGEPLPKQAPPPEQEEDEAAQDPSSPTIELGPLPTRQAASNKIARVELSCDVPFCDDLENIEALKDTTGLWPGQSYNKERIQRARLRLLKTGYFSTVELAEEHLAEGHVIRFLTEGLPIIRELNFEGTGELFESEITKRLFLRPGRPFFPRSASLRKIENLSELSRKNLEDLAISDQKQAIRHLYHSEGFYDAVVQIETRLKDDYYVDLDITIDQGPPYALGAVYLRGHDALSYEEVESELRDEFGFFSNFTSEQFSQGVDAVANLYRNEGYLQVRISKDFRRDPRRHVFDVYLDIREGKRWNIQFEGNQIIEDDELLENLTFYEVGFIDEAEIENSKDSLLKLYETVGRYWANIDYQLELVDNVYQLSFNIEEGPRSEIVSIQFEGAQALSTDFLLEQIRSQPYQAFGTGAFPQISLIADDAAIIVDAYHAAGYLHARVDGWRLASLDSTEELELTFFIVEGELTIVNQTLVQTLEQDTIAKAYQAMETKPGTPFSPLDVVADQSRLLRPLRAKGYVHAKVEARCVPSSNDPALDLDSQDENPLTSALLGAASQGARSLDINSCEPSPMPAGCLPAEPEELCSRDTLARGRRIETCRRTYTFIGDDPENGRCNESAGLGERVDIGFHITTGLQRFVGDFFIHGNFVTHRWVVLQDFPFDKNDTFDLNKLLAARSRLRSRSIYESVTVEAIGLEEGRGKVSANDDITHIPLVVHVEEGLRRWLDLAVGTSYLVGEWIAVAEAELVEANFLGTGWKLSLLAMPEFRFINDNDEWVLTKNFNQNWFSLITFEIPLAPAAGIDLIIQGYYDLRYIPDTNIEEQGGVAEFRWNISRNWFASLAFEGKLSADSGVTDEVESYDACYPFAFFQNCPFDERLITVSTQPRTVFDRRDSPLSPTDGYLLDGRLKFAYSEDVGYILKPDFSASTYFHFLRNFTLAINGRTAFAWVENGNALPYFERFFLGGINMRGFEVDGVGPRRRDPDNPGAPTAEAGGGEFLVNTNIELRFPILKDAGIHGVLFWDAGTLLEEQFMDYDSASTFFRDLFWSETRHSVGLGLRWLIAENLPPLVIDYGVLLNRRIGEPFGGLHFNVGYTF